VFESCEPMMINFMIAAIQWLPEDRVTLFTTEGLIQIGGSLVRRRFRPSDVKAFKILVTCFHVSNILSWISNIDMGRNWLVSSSIKWP